MAKSMLRYVTTAAAASVLLAVSAPVAAAKPSGPPPKPPHTGGSVQHPGATSSQSTSTMTVSAQTTNNKAPADPGINIGNPPPGMPGTTGNVDYGNQSNPASVQFFNLGTGNNTVANNTCTVPSSTGSSGGPGVNLVNLGNSNIASGIQFVNGAGNFGINVVSAGNVNTADSATNFVNDLASTTSTGLFGSDLAFLGSTNSEVGFNEVEGSDSAGMNVVSAGSGNRDSGINGVIGEVGPAFGANFASLGNNNLFGEPIEPFVVGSNLVVNSGGAGTFTAGANFVSVGDSARSSGLNTVTGADTFGTNFAVVLSTAAAPTSGSGNNIVENNNVFGSNFAVVAAGSHNVGTNFSTATGGGFNFVLTDTALTDAGNNTGGGINIAIDPTQASPGNCSKSLCINLFGMQLL